CCFFPPVAGLSRDLRSFPTRRSSDLGACALLVASQSAIAEHGLTPRARVVGMACAGVEPRIMGIGPAPATRRVLELTGLTLDQIDRKSTRLNSSHVKISYAVFCLKKK